MNPMIIAAAIQAAGQALGPQPNNAPQPTAQVPTSTFQGGNVVNPFNQQRGQQMVTGLGPLVPPVLSREQLDAMEKTIESPSKRQVTDTAEAEQAGWGSKLKTAATSPEAIAAMMQLALAPSPSGAPSVSPMNTTSSFQGGGMNPYQMLAQRRR